MSIQVDELYKYIDHTLLKPTATNEEIIKICDESIKYKTASICIPPSYIEFVKKKYDNQVNICTVVGFPLGYSVKESKMLETKKAIEDGANEVDMVINITDIKNKNYDIVLDEIKSLKSICNEKILKVIIETCYLTDEEKIECCKLVTDGKADYIKTSTGFGTKGAELNDIILFKKHVGDNVKIKAAGGMKEVRDMIAFVENGADRLGTSSGIKLINEYKKQN